MLPRWLIALTILGCFLLAGCGSADWATASGTVNLDSKPLEAGVATFHPVGGGPDAYGQVKSGKYTVYTGEKAGLKTGQYVVTVTASTIPTSGTKEQSKLLTPQKYASPKTSDLKADVKSGSNSFTFELKSTP